MLPGFLNSQKGYISFVLVVFALLIAVLIFPYRFPTVDSQPATTGTPTGFCELVDAASAPTIQGPADFATKTSESGAPEGSRVISTSCDETFPVHILSPGNTTYRLIRKGVPLSTTDVKGNDANFDGDSCHFSTTEQIGAVMSGVDTTKFKVFYPQISGEISLDRQIPSRTRGGDSDLMYFIDYGLVFLLHTNPDGSFTELQGGTTQGEAETFYLADIYQDIGSGRPQLPSDAFACDSTAGSNFATQVIIPNQSPSTTQDQLQLQYFVFSGGGVVNGWGIHCKPAVYLYPPKAQLVNVKVHPSGFLTYTDPPYNLETGWTVEAFPDGSLFSLSPSPLTLYPYLYFESKIKDEVIEKPEKGWVIKSETDNSEQMTKETNWFSPLENHFRETLPKLGLNQKQTNDFIDYWKKALPYSPYYFVGIIDQDNVNEIERLEITPQPDSINRVRVYFERLDNPKTVEAPVINPSPFTLNSSQFKVVEWGGMVKTDPNHPFTCSQ